MDRTRSIYIAALRSSRKPKVPWVCLRHDSFSSSTKHSALAQRQWSRKEKLGLALFGSLVVGTAGLGVWQTQRYFWKVEQVQRRKEGLERPAEPLTSAGGVPEEHHLYSLLGRFAHDKELRIGPRGAPASLTGGGGGGLGVSPQGYYIITPLVSSGDGSVVLVNRGWAPRNVEMDRSEGPVTVVGVISGGEKQGTFSPVNDLSSGRAFWMDLKGFCRYLGLPEDTKYMVQTSSSGASAQQSRWPMPKSTKDLESFHVMPPTHLAYAITWFSLAAFGAVASRRLIRPR